MVPHLLLFVLLLAAGVGCSDSSSSSQPAPKAKAEVAREPEAKTPANYRKVLAQVPEGFPLEIPPGDDLVASESRPSNGKQLYELQFESKKDPEALVTHWEDAMRRREVAVKQTVTDGDGFRSIVLAGATPDGTRARVSILENPPFEGDPRPIQVRVSWGGE